VLYIPPYWWHEVENLTPTIAVSLRYAPSRADTLRHPRTYKAALWHHGKGYFLRWAKLHRPKAASG
jgi:ribosomal protein L16 Arg81 hydroxylase